MKGNDGMITFEQVRENPAVQAYMEKGNRNLGVLGYTEHGRAHAAMAAETAAMILTKLGHSERDIELARIAGYMHDIGNCVNRNDHAHSGSLMAMQVLGGMGMDVEEIAVIMAAIGNHDEKTGTAVDAVSAALILADKCDVRRSRVREQKAIEFDIHDRVNYAVTSAKLSVDAEKKVIALDIEIDDAICPVMEYFEIFMERMLMCRRAAQLLGCRFSLRANGGKVL